jgi:hypothetical protein
VIGEEYWATTLLLYFLEHLHEMPTSLGGQVSLSVNLEMECNELYVLPVRLCC